MSRPYYNRAPVMALVTARAEPGLWLEHVPEPELGIDDVLEELGNTA